jgi:hypothetical protein
MPSLAMPSLAAKRPLHGPNAWRADDGEHIAKTTATMHARLILSLPAPSAPHRMTGRLHQHPASFATVFCDDGTAMAVSARRGQLK